MPQMGNKLYSLFMFCTVSVLAGLLTAGLAIPVVGVASETVKVGVDALENLPAELEIPPQPEKSQLLMSDGSVLTNFFDENRQYVPLAKIAPIMLQAQVAIEDHRFYKHGAIDIQGTMRALVRTASGTVQGGSTLTQQYVKMVLVEIAMMKGDVEAVAAAQARSVARKVQELRYAVALEQRFTKDEILERYVNIAYYGDGAYGVEAAAHHYFGTTAEKLTLAQAAMLAGLVQNPVSTDPVNNPKAAIERRNIVLNRMAELGIITVAEAKAAADEKFDKSKVVRSVQGCANSRYPFLCQYAENVLLNSPELGQDRQTRKNMLYRGGLTIQTQIDPKTQDAAENAVKKFIGPEDPLVSVIVMLQPGTGLILGMAQNKFQMGNGPGQTFYNYAVDRSMGGAEGYQAGSTFKAYTLAAALDKGIPPNRKYTSSGTQNFKDEWFTSCTGKFHPYGDWNVRSQSGNFDMYSAAKASVNNYFVQLERDTGMCEVTGMAQKLGVKLGMGGNIVETFQERPSFTLGTADITPMSNAEAFATFAARGVHCDPIILKSITNKKGENIPVPSANCKRVLSEVVADYVNDILQGPLSGGGTAGSARLPGNYSQAGKTGTTDDGRSIWFVGYTPEVAGAAMIAVDNGNPYWSGKRKSVSGVRLQNGGYLGGSSGGDTGARLWRPAMIEALKNWTPTQFVKPGKLAEGPPTPVPSCVGQHVNDCSRLLMEAGFGVDEQRRENDAGKDTVIGLNPSGMAPKYSTIVVVVSDGPPPPPPPPPAVVPPTDPNLPKPPPAQPKPKPGP